MKSHRLLAFILPLVALSGCSYRGDVKPLQDGELLMRGSYEVRSDSFAIVDQHIKANDSFCIYFSLEGCSACEEFDEGFREVIIENKLLTFHLDYANKKDEIDQIYASYPELRSQYAPSFFICEGVKFTELEFSTINSESRFRNTLKRNVSLSDHYFFENEVNYQEALNKTEFTSATVIELDPANEEQLGKYHEELKKEGAMFIRYKVGLPSISIGQITK